jgi:leucyl-tRNA synthetase
MLHERGLAYQAESLVNYDPVDKTVLANEQVDANGCSWRSGAKVEKVMLKQWFLKIKEFQEPLLKDLNALSEGGKWPEKVLAMQRNWLGRSEGTQLRFDIESLEGNTRFEPVDVFTTRVDTLFGVQYLALSPGHPIVQKLAVEDESLRTFIKEAKDLPADTKRGYLLPNIVAKNPIHKVIQIIDVALPIYVAPYVLDDYGSGAVMGVPGHDARDHAFWRANVGDDPVKVVIAIKPGVPVKQLVPLHTDDVPFTQRGYVASDIAVFGDISSNDAAWKIASTLRKAGKSAEMTTNWRLRDWLISRQRYWGTPIPIIHCSSCGAVPVPEEELPVKLLNLPDSFFEGQKGNPLAEDEHWKRTTCPKCGSAAERETDTMDTFMDSSWYFFRFLDPNNQTMLVDPEKANKAMPVDLYVGGVEHAILHLLYARFISKFLATTSTWPEGSLVNGEPFKRLITQGMVHGKTYTDPENGRFLTPDEMEWTTPSNPIIKASGLAPTVSYEKMSKSKYNGVDPGATIAKYGADATRAHMLFQAPVGDVLEWHEKKIAGVERWLQKVIRLSSAFWMPDEEMLHFKWSSELDLTLVNILRTYPAPSTIALTNASSEHTEEELLTTIKPQDAKLWIKTQRVIASVTESYSQTYSLNTVISDLMTLTNAIGDAPQSSSATPYIKWYATAHLIRMLAPVAPGVAEEAWFQLTSSFIAQDRVKRPVTVFATGFPIADLDIIPRLTQTITCVVQVGGKRRFQVEIPKSLDTNADAAGRNITHWVLDQLLATKDGKEWLMPGTGKVWKISDTKTPHSVFSTLPEDWQVVVVEGGRLVNLFRHKKKAKKIGSQSRVSEDGLTTLGNE